MREPFFTGEFYHIYNRGADKREIFLDSFDMDRFFMSMLLFNTTEPIGSIYEHSRGKWTFGDRVPKGPRLVDFVAYCLNQNHFHFIVKQVSDHGISRFMHKLGSGYTTYFNERYDRSGVLFQGKFKAKHISSDEYLLHLSAYVNLNFHVHRVGDRVPKPRSSFGEYEKENFQRLCDTKIVLSQFASREDYISYAEEALADILKRRENEDGLKKILLE